MESRVVPCPGADGCAVSIILVSKLLIQKKVGMKYRILSLSLCFFFSLISSTLDARQPLKILAIGNSFSADAVEEFLDDLAKKGGAEVVIGNAFIGGCSLERHWSNADKDLQAYSYRKVVNNKKSISKKTLLQCIQDEKWDYITFQQVSTLSGMVSSYFPYLKDLVDYVKQHATNPQVKLAMHQTWAYAKDSSKPAFKTYHRNQMDMYNAIVESVWSAADSVGIDLVIPSGTAIQNARTSILGDVFNRDGSHLNRLGKYTTACVWYEVFTGDSPVGNSFAPDSLTAFQRAIAQNAAHLAVSSPKRVSSMRFSEGLVKEPNEHLKQSEFLMFQSGFEDHTVIVPAGQYNHRMTGWDSNLKKSDWVADITALMDEVSITYTKGDSTKRLASIVADPVRPQNRVLQFLIKEPWMTDTTEKARIQCDFYGIKNGLKEFTQSMRVYLPENMNELRYYPDVITWFTIVELWNNVAWRPAVPYGGRVTLGLTKPVSGESDLYFKVDAQDIDRKLPPDQRFKTLWVEKNNRIKVPVGEWFTLEFYCKEGDKQNGRFYMTMETEDGNKQVVFDITNYTHNSQDPSPDGITEFNPLKLYTSKEISTYMKTKGKALQLLWDDLKLWGK